MAGLTLDKVTKVYEDGFTAVKEIDLTINDGELVVLVGPSGCGKSTTLRMIAGLESITSGSLTIGGRAMNIVRPKDRDIAMVFQSYALYPHLNVADNMGFSLRMNNTPKGERIKRVNEAAALLGLESVLHKKPGHLSGGQRQRVALGRAIVRKPSVFLFDEPLSNLDPDRRAATRAEIRRIQRELGTTTVYVTHDHEEAMALGDQIVIMKNGRIEQSGPPSHIYEHPRSLFVGLFLGAPKMNALACTVRAEGTDLRAQAIGTNGAISLPLNGDASQAGPGDAITVGIRPQHILLDREGGADRLITIGSGRIVDIERLGFACDLTFDVSGQKLIVRSPRMTGWSVGQTHTLRTDPMKMHAFLEAGDGAQPPDS